MGLSQGARVFDARPCSISHVARSWLGQATSPVSQALTGLGIGLGGLATSLWSIRMVANGGMNRVTGGMGLALGALAACWLLAGQGEFGLYPAVTTTIAFGVWSLIVAIQMIRGRL